MKKIDMTLSVNSINSAIEQLEQYKKELIKKNEIFVNRLAQYGLNVVNMKVLQSRGDSEDAKSKMQINSMGEVTYAELHLSGKDVLFIEFGSGIYYNQGNEHPLAGQFGYGVGTYPGQTHAYEDFWFYTSKDGSSNISHGSTNISHGTEATMPMYNSVIEMYKQIYSIAKEVFGG